MAASLWLRSLDGALRTIAGYEAMNVIRKGQIRWLAKNDALGQMHYIEQIFGIAPQQHPCLGNRPHSRQPIATDPKM
jgi:hypothetical protein